MLPYYIHPGRGSPSLQGTGLKSESLGYTGLDYAEGNKSLVRQPHYLPQ